jgi:lipopolysaccharide/colanic/teichoic acid biosynthesis glycosyltransferase
LNIIISSIALLVSSPVLFRQEHVGLHSTTFSILKFTPMEQGAEKPSDMGDPSSAFARGYARPSLLVLLIGQIVEKRSQRCQTDNS